MDNNEENIERLHTRLAKGKHLVQFEKRDGTIRDMYCTTDMAIIENLSPSTIEKLNEHQTQIERGEKKERKTNHNMFRVFDVEKMDWRSFNIDQVLSVSPFDESDEWQRSAKADQNE